MACRLVAFLWKHMRHNNYRLTADEIAERYNTDLSNQIVLITGGSGTVGYATMESLLKRGATIINVGRSAKTLKQVEDKLHNDYAHLSDIQNRVYSVVMELESFSSVKEGAEQIKRLIKQLDLPLKIIIANSGIMAINYRQTRDGMDPQWQVNYFSHYYLITLLHTELKAAAPSRVVLVSSSYHALLHTGGALHIQYDKLPYPPEKGYQRFQPYQQSKLALVMIANELNDRYSNDGITVLSCNPGGIVSNLQIESGSQAMMRWTNRMWKTPAQGASTQVYCALAPQREIVGGQYYDNCEVWSSQHFQELGQGVSKDERVKLYEYTQGFLSKYGAN